MAQPRIEQRVENINNQTDEDKDCGEYKRDALHHRIIAILDRFIDVPTYTR